MAREEADKMNRLSGCVYTAVNYMVTPNGPVRRSVASTGLLGKDSGAK